MSPVHFGDVANGGNLERVNITFSSDSLYSAICNELAPNKTILKQFIDLISSGIIKLSSLFPYYCEDENEWQCYLPKPVLNVQRPIKPMSFEETKKNATVLKKVKKVEFVRASVLSDDEQKFNFDTLMLDAETMPSFGYSQVVTRVNRRVNPGEPYHVGNYRFNDEAGLYGIVAFETNEAKQLFDYIIELLGYSGIGGKRSGGYGKFELRHSAILIDQSSDSEDISSLYHLLHNNSAMQYMSIASVIPQADELDTVVKGQYALRKRSGFVQSSSMSENMKRNSCYSIKEGSCFDGVLKGQIVTFTHHGLNHALERNGLGFFVGVNYDEYTEN